MIIIKKQIKILQVVEGLNHRMISMKKLKKKFQLKKLLLQKKAQKKEN